MKGNVYWVAPVLLTLVLVFSFVTVSAEFNKENAAKIFNKIDKNKFFERVIADHADKKHIEMFKKMGCLLKHRLKGSASFECPEDILPRLNARKARIFHIMDLGADEQTGADKVWAEGITGSGVNVAVLDTGIDLDHPELKDSYLGGYDFVNNDPVPDDDHGHGTHVAGIITANGADDMDSKGVSPSAGIYMYKVCDAGGSCYEDDMMAAMEAAVETDAKVMSISIGGGSYTGENCDSDPLAEKVNWVVDQGLTAVIAAGNDGRGVSSPGCASKAIAVGAVDSGNSVPYWSGRGNALDIVAPGVDIYSTYLNDGYEYMSGTSMATPHVAGVVSLLLEANPDLTTDGIKTALYDTASPVNKCYGCTRWWGYYCFRQAQTTCTPEITGAGVVNAYEAYLAVKPTGPECMVDDDCNDFVGCTDNSCINGTCVYITNDDNCHIDEWTDTGNKRWVSDDQCTEKEQKEQEYRDYYCDAILDCQYMVTGTRWIGTGITRNKADGTLCDDGLFCNVNETCQAGVCTGGVSKDCNDFDICTADSCNEDTDSCEHSPAAADGTPCDDGLFCTVNDMCMSGACKGAAKDCSDGIACTADSCDEVNDICVNTPDNSYCDDDLFCNGLEICDVDLGCQSGDPVVCNDNNECTTDSCNEGIDACEYTNVADDTACAEGICCGGTCSSPVCSMDAECEDFDACTADICFNPGTCSAVCDNEEISTCRNDDGCCPSGCDYTNDNDCQATTKCWSSEFAYIKRSSTQFKKFCKCTEGTYAYQSYGYVWGKRTAYQYRDSGDNENWETRSSKTYFPAYRVRCADGSWYYTNQDYYYG